MYFSISEVKHDRAAQLALMTANQLGESMMAGEQSSVAFESAIASISRKANIPDTALVAAQLLAQDVEYRKKAINVGLKEMVRVLGGEENTKEFFKQITLPKATIRFESVGGVRDDVHAAKNRAAMLAMRAAFGRKLKPEVKERMPAENEYKEFVKSVYRTLDTAIYNGQINAGVAHRLSVEINEAAHAELSPAMKTHIAALQGEASKDIAQETRLRIVARYNKGSSHDHDGPIVH